MKNKGKNGMPAGSRARLNALREKTVKPVYDLQVRVGVSREPVAWEEKETLQYRPVRPGQVWAPHVYDCGWFYVSGTLPENALADPTLALEIRLGAEGLIYTNNGAPWEMVSAKILPVDSLTVERGKSMARLCEGLIENGRLGFYIDAGFNGTIFNGPFGVGVFHSAGIVRIDPAFYAFYYDYLTALSLYASLPKGEGEALLSAANGAFAAAMAGEPARGRELLSPVLHGAPADFTLYAVGHSHLDLAWLLRQALPTPSSFW